jgi:L-threonylcarbamoyladenylate synthase
MGNIIKINDRKIIESIKNDGVGAIPTDTLYGLVGSAFSKKTVARIYRIKKRNSKKPFIILISSIKDLSKFGIELDDFSRNFLQKNWPGPMSVILPCLEKKFIYLHRGTKALAFRCPKKASLLKLIRKTGPLVAPSANPEGLKPAENISEIYKYFGSQIDFYVRGKVSQTPSTLVEIKNSKIMVLRRGTGKIK